MERSKKRALTGFGVALLFILGFAVFGLFNIKTVIVSGPSMMPTLHTGQRVLATKAYWLVGGLQKKDIVVVTDSGPTGYMIKRINAMPGEAVAWTLAPRTWDVTRGEYVVPEGHVWVIGDNHSVSEDSRDFGPVPLDKILGKVVVWR
jgi:signal peptidase I